MLAAVTVFAAFGLKKFRTTYMTEEVFVNVNEYTKKNEYRFKELFGSNDNIVLLIKSDYIFKSEVLNMIQEIEN
ncbi:hypothetical protein [Treponema pedis]|uniref:hypothetical protein n=1 Tax=Treponema pedis TaxID=409322 RepID=UPI001CEF7DDE|nr:hypothetical protein [Treponema pedis]